MTFRRNFPGMLVASIAAAVAQSAAGQSMEAAPLVTPFSMSRVTSALPAGWDAVPIGAGKNPTVYRLVDDAGVVVLSAHAVNAASGLGQTVNFDIRSAPIVEWRWKVSHLIEAADNAVASKEDSPARLILEFDGDKSKLGLKEQALFSFGGKVAGHDIPYATLMYIWSNHAPVGSVILNTHTSRVRMVVAESGPAGVGAWQVLRRNAVDDYKKAYGEDPGRLIGVGVLTDTDNTGDSVDAWYGDIKFLPADR